MALDVNYFLGIRKKVIKKLTAAKTIVIMSKIVLKSIFLFPSFRLFKSIDKNASP